MPALCTGALCLLFVRVWDSVSTPPILTVYGVVLLLLLAGGLALLPILDRETLLTPIPARAAYVSGALAALGLFAAYPGKGITAAYLALLAGVGLVLWMTGRMTVDRFTSLLLLASLCVNLTYISYLRYFDNQHDVYGIGSEVGHMAYLEYFLKNGFRLFPFDPREVFQFYQPPLHPFVSALWVRAQTLVGIGYEQAVENLQLLPVFYTSVIQVALYRILKDLRLKGAAFAIPMLLLAFLPGMVIFSGAINNDMMSAMFSVLAFRYALAWYRDARLVVILKAALCVGFAMMAKLSGVLVAPAIAFLFLVKFIQSDGKRPFVFGQVFLFGCVSVPLGLWWEVRNLLRFDMPITYIHKISVLQTQYIRDNSIINRLLDFSGGQLVNPYLSFQGMNLDKNIFLALVKSALFDEVHMGKCPSLDRAAPYLFVGGIFLALAAFVLFCWMLTRESESVGRIERYYLGIAFFTGMASYVAFCFQYPFVCTQSFRYVIPAFFVCLIGVGVFLQGEKKRPYLPQKRAKRVVKPLAHAGTEEK